MHGRWHLWPCVVLLPETSCLQEIIWQRWPQPVDPRHDCLQHFCSACSQLPSGSYMSCCALLRWQLAAAQTNSGGRSCRDLVHANAHPGAIQTVRAVVWFNAKSIWNVIMQRRLGWDIFMGIYARGVCEGVKGEGVKGV